jgi:hypothetical protein
MRAGNAFARLGFPSPARLGFPSRLSPETLIRGIHRFANSADPASEFCKEMRRSNLNFAAGESGTTSTLFQSALLFGGNLAREDKKTYFMAVVCYLVGGGNHTCHEIFKTAALSGIDVPYTSVGGYDEAFPSHFLKHKDVEAWRHEFSDVTGAARFQLPFPARGIAVVLSRPGRRHLVASMLRRWPQIRPIRP